MSLFLLCGLLRSAPTLKNIPYHIFFRLPFVLQYGIPSTAPPTTFSSLRHSLAHVFAHICLFVIISSVCAPHYIIRCAGRCFFPTSSNLYTHEMLFLICASCVRFFAHLFFFVCGKRNSILICFYSFLSH